MGQISEITLQGVDQATVQLALFWLDAMQVQIYRRQPGKQGRTGEHRAGHELALGLARLAIQQQVQPMAIGSEMILKAVAFNAVNAGPDGVDAIKQPIGHELVADQCFDVHPKPIPAVGKMSRSLGVNLHKMMVTRQFQERRDPKRKGKTSRPRLGTRKQAAWAASKQ